jgi:hypothetical protein
MSSNLPPGPSLAPAPTAVPAADLARWLGRIGLGKPGGLIVLALLLVALAGLVLAWGLRRHQPVPAPAQALRLAEAPAPDTPQSGGEAPAPRRTDMPLAEPEPSGLPAAAAGALSIAPSNAPNQVPNPAPPTGAAAGGNELPPPVMPRAPEVGLLQAAAQDIKTLLDHQQRQAERIEQLGQQVAGLAAAVDRLQARQVAARRMVRRAAAPVAAASAPAAPAAAQAQLLSVDMWDGRPSVVIGTGSAEDRRVRFLAEGDRQSGIALKHASPHEQRAVIDVAGREVVLDREGQR